ncbi:RelA/SpoT family protein [Candidatus Saccharibacteria bacterium]|nr:RelA/SpoT family protein [Candidatus Saccharibacteria bacterium]
MKTLASLAREKFPRETDRGQIYAATDFAKEKHAGQKRLSGEDYVTHPLAVARILLEWDMDLDSVIAGLLHDVVEDTDTPLSEIEEKFGEDVARLVDGVTKVGMTRAGRDDISTYLPETKDNLAKLMIATGSDIRVIIIKLADRLHNLRTLEFQPREKQLKKARESLEVFGPLADRLNMGRVRTEVEEIAFRYIAPKRYNKLKRELDFHLGSARKKLDKIRGEVAAKLREEKLPAEIDGRVKSVYSLHKKLEKYDGDFDRIHDLMALRIVVDDVSTCYLVLGVIHSLYTPMIARIKDYIARPKNNGYQSLHTTVETSDGQIVEFQIRTHEMHDYAERGLAASFHYNENKLTEVYKSGKLAPLPANLKWIQDLQEAVVKLRAGKKVDFNALKIHIFSDRIFVYTPRGDIFDLPAGALPLDFAYRVHTDLAAKASGFKINGKMVKFDRELKSGDIVEVLTHNKTSPKLDWLKKIMTSHARTKLRSQLRHQNIETARRENIQKPTGPWNRRGNNSGGKKN